MSQTGQTGLEGGSAGDSLDAEEFGAAVDGLSATDKLKLREIERVYLRGTDLKETTDQGRALRRAGGRSGQRRER
jgi:hypothetical protein